jgi:DNA-binding MarR family transcriptional regulator
VAAAAWQCPGYARPVQHKAATVSNESPSPASALQPELEELRHAIYVLTTAERRMARRYERSGENRGPGRLNLLSYLAAEGERTHGQLARYCKLNPATITLLVDQLLRQGVVQRRQDPLDRRVWWISLTPDGLQTIDDIKQEWHEQFEAAFADTPPEVLRAARDVIDKVAEVFDSLGDSSQNL